MKKIAYLTLVLFATLFTVPISQAQNATNTFTAADVTKLDNGINDLLPLIPAQFQHFAIQAIALIGVLAMFGRVVIGWRNNGIPGAFAGLFGGTNTPIDTASHGDVSRALVSGNAYPPKEASGLRQTSLMLLAMLGLSALMFTGCKSYQMAHATSGSGLNLNASVPIPMSGGQTLLGVNLMAGFWKQADVIQPTGTNATISPSVAINMATTGNAAASGQASATGAGTNGIAGVTAADKEHLTLLTGQATESTTNVSWTTGK